MIIGRFNSSLFLKIFSLLLAATVTLIYLISQVLHHEKRITWISSCAQHFPQYVFFRIATISGSVFLVLGWITNHFYIKTICSQYKFNISKYKPQIMMILGIMGSFLLMGSTANIDTGKMNEHWHTSCASSFFVMTFFGLILNMVLSSIIQYQIKIFNKVNFNLRLIFTFLLIILVILTTKSQYHSQINSNLGIYLEWAGTYVIAILFYLMSKDIQQYNFIYQYK